MVTILILTVAACEASIALALIVVLYNRRSSLDVTLWQEIREPLAAATSPAVVAEEAEPFDAIPGPETYPHLSPAGVEPEHPVQPWIRKTFLNQRDRQMYVGFDRASSLVSDFFITKAWLIPFFPLLGAILAALAPRNLRSRAHIPVVVGIALRFLISIGSLFSAGADATVLSFHWLSVSDLESPVELRVDGLSTMMLSMVTLVSTIVAVFSAGYMQGDPGYPRFFALIGLFVFSMTGPRAIQQLCAHIRFLGRRRRMQLPAHRLLAHEAKRGRGGAQGVPRQPHRRLRLRDRHLLDVVGLQSRPEI